MATMAAMARLESKVTELFRWPCTCSSCSEIVEEVQRLSRTGRRICALLCDAEEREITEESVKLWLSDLRDVAYDAEDLVEEFEYPLLWHRSVCEKEQQEQIALEERGTRCKRQVGDPHIASHCPALHDASFQQQIIAKIIDINNRFDKICEHRDALKLRKKDGQMHHKHYMMESPPSSSVSANSQVYGRKGDKDRVVGMLISSRSHKHVGAENVSVVSIVGMGGIGKTTLAELVYNDDKVRKHFVLKSWICVSDIFDVVRLTKEILEAVTAKTIDLQQLDPLQQKLREHLKGKRFLVVLDDLWNQSWGHWEALWKPLCTGAEGSRVLITTRNEEVSSTSRAVSIHRLGVLSRDDCWSLFAQCAFGCKNPSDHPKLVSIGKEIVQKCGGLPLAVKTLGGLLFDESDEDRWNDILKSNIWGLPEEKNGILPALKVSYYYLPSPIKPCFAFCAVFPKDYLIDLQALVPFWIALGYIQPTGGRSMEDMGWKYVEDLQRRSLLHKYPTLWGKMHDLIHDLAVSVWGSECSTVEDGKSFDDAARKVRHVFFNNHKADMTLLSWESTNKFQCLRTFYLHHRLRNDGPSVLSSRVLDDMFCGMKYLRVLYLLDMPISELPDSVGNLKHLRYLSVRGKNLRSLPKTLGNLLNLQILEVRKADTLKELPETLGNLLNLQKLTVEEGFILKELPMRLTELVNLRHLCLHRCPLSMLPRGMGRLTQLQTLETFVVGEGICAAGIEELRHLNDLQGKLEIVFKSLSNWVSREANILSSKKGLQKLALTFPEYDDTSDDESCSATMQQQQRQQQQQQEEFLELIQPHPNIEKLCISDYIGIKLPKWMEDPCYSRLESLTLIRCGNCRHLPALGQLPALKNLRVCDMTDLRSVGREFLGEGRVVRGAYPFPSLEWLLFHWLSKLEEILLIGTEDGYAFPRLRVLEIEHCSKLKNVKLQPLFALEELVIKECNKLTTLDCYHVTSVSQSESLGLQEDALHYVHILPAAELQRPSSLSRLDVRGSPVLMEWVRRHANKLVGVKILRDGC